MNDFVDKAPGETAPVVISPPTPAAHQPGATPLPKPREQRRVVAPEPSHADTEETRASEPIVLTPVTILYKHRGGPAFLSISLDGERVWNQELQPAEGRIQKLTGYGNRAVIAVPPGTHTLEINLRDPERGVDAIQAIRSRYTNGRRRTLRVSVDPKDNVLQLRWKE